MKEHHDEENIDSNFDLIDSVLSEFQELYDPCQSQHSNKLNHSNDLQLRGVSVHEESKEVIKRNSCQSVDKESSPKVIQGYLPSIFNFKPSFLVRVRCSKVNTNIHKEQEINHKVKIENIIVVKLFWLERHRNRYLKRVPCREKHDENVPFNLVGMQIADHPDFISFLMLDLLQCLVSELNIILANYLILLVEWLHYLVNQLQGS
jgi:hypothetical protein